MMSMITYRSNQVHLAGPSRPDERASSASAPRSRWVRHSEISDDYKPSRTNSAPLPSLPARSSPARISALYFARN